MTIYLDVTFAVNFGMDLSLLYWTGKLAQEPAGPGRLCLGAAAGAAAACWWACRPVLPSLAAAFLALLAALWVCFGPRRLSVWGKLVFFALVLSFALGGAVTVLMERTGAFSLWLLIAASLGAYLAFWWGGRLLETHVQNRRGYCRLEIFFAGSAVQATVLLDTGNRLRDPLTGCPVAVVAFSVLRELFPPAARLLYDQGRGDQLEALIAALSGHPLEKRLRLIPFCSLGTRSGLLLGFAADRVDVLLPDGGRRCLGRVEIGVSTQDLGACDGLLEPGVLEEGCA